MNDVRVDDPSPAAWSAGELATWWRDALRSATGHPAPDGASTGTEAGPWPPGTHMVRSWTWRAGAAEVVGLVLDGEDGVVVDRAEGGDPGAALAPQEWLEVLGRSFGGWDEEPGDPGARPTSEVLGPDEARAVAEACSAYGHLVVLALDAVGQASGPWIVRWCQDGDGWHLLVPEPGVPRSFRLRGCAPLDPLSATVSILRNTGPAGGGRAGA